VGEFSHYRLLLYAPRYFIVVSGGSAGFNAYSVHVQQDSVSFFLPYFHLMIYSFISLQFSS
jgi:hypothetical protein